MSDFFEPQVPKEHYYDDYDDVLRFVSYYSQIDAAMSLKPEKTLEIGIGNSTVANYLRQAGMNLTTCDFDAELKPDVVADIRNLPFEDNSFDLVMACEILEHLPWEDAKNALVELNRVTRKHVIVSIPYASEAFEIVIRFPMIKRFFKKNYFNICIRIPHFFRKMKFDGQHYWEIGRGGYPKRKVVKMFKEVFNLKKQFRPILKHHHQYFILEVK